MITKSIAFLIYLAFRLLVGFFAFLMLAEMYFFVKNQLQFYDRTLLSILQNDFSTNFPEENKRDNFKNLYLLYETLKVQQQEQKSKELIYRSLLNNIDSAALILEKK